MAGGSETKVLFQNVSGMVTNQKNRHKMKVMQETMEVDVALLTETACTKKEKLWTCEDQIEVVQNNHVVEDDRQTIVSGLGTAILARNNTHIQKGEKQFNNEKMALGHLRIDRG